MVLDLKIFKHKNLIFKHGKKAIILKKSYDGKNWEKMNNNEENGKPLNDTTGHICYELSFKNDKEATCYYEVNNSPLHLYTIDGGKVWQEKK